MTVPPSLPPALSGTIETLGTPSGTIAVYRNGSPEAAPLLLLHSVNACANAYEVKPLYEHYAGTRAVYAPDLPGFGLSDRHDMVYTPRLMTDAVLALTHEIRHRHGGAPIDALAVSTSCEFLARAASEGPGLYRSLAFVSPTGMTKQRRGDGPSGKNFGIEPLRRVLAYPLWGHRLFRILASRTSIRFFLQKTWGSRQIDEGLIDYDYLCAQQPGAEFAPFSFVSGYLFSADIMTIYKSLTQRVWMTHGVRGDFTDYTRKSEIEGRPNWTVQIFQTGALSHFEQLGAFTAAYNLVLEPASDVSQP